MKRTDAQLKTTSNKKIPIRGTTAPIRGAEDDDAVKRENLNEDKPDRKAIEVGERTGYARDQTGI